MPMHWDHRVYFTSLMFVVEVKIFIMENDSQAFSHLDKSNLYVHIHRL